jgi:hypothetical protein
VLIEQAQLTTPVGCPKREIGLSVRLALNGHPDAREPPTTVGVAIGVVDGSSSLLSSGPPQEDGQPISLLSTILETMVNQPDTLKQTHRLVLQKV